MSTRFDADDRGKPVENEAGETVGTIESVEGNVAYVRPKPDVVDSITSSVGWESRADETLPLEVNDVAEITDEAVRLSGTLVERTATDVGATGPDSQDASRTEPAGGMSGLDETDVSEALGEEDADIMEETNRGAEADPTELMDDASEFEVHPDDADQRTDAAVDPDEDAERTDAEVDPTELERDEE